jgi:hypothetical protein
MPSSEACEKLINLQSTLDDAASSGELSEAAYLRACQEIKRVFETLDLNAVAIQERSFAQLVLAEPTIISSSTPSIYGMSPHILRMVFEEEAADPQPTFWWRDFVNTIFDMLFDHDVYHSFEQMEIAGLLLVDAPKARFYVANAFNCHSNRCAFCYFREHLAVSRAEYKVFVEHVLKAAADFIVECANTPCCLARSGSQWRRMVTLARRHATEAMWDEQSFRDVVGPRDMDRVLRKRRALSGLESPRVTSACVCPNCSSETPPVELEPV